MNTSACPSPVTSPAMGVTAEHPAGSNAARRGTAPSKASRGKSPLSNACVRLLEPLAPVTARFSYHTTDPLLDDNKSTSPSASMSTADTVVEVANASVAGAAALERPVWNSCDRGRHANPLPSEHRAAGKEPGAQLLSHGLHAPGLKAPQPSNDPLGHVAGSAHGTHVNPDPSTKAHHAPVSHAGKHGPSMPPPSSSPSSNRAHTGGNAHVTAAKTPSVSSTCNLGARRRR